MPTDDVIEAALAPLRPMTRRSVPVEGDWAPPPFPDRVVDGRPVAVICAGPGLSAIVVDRERRTVGPLLVDKAGPGHQDEELPDAVVDPTEPDKPNIRPMTE